MKQENFWKPDKDEKIKIRLLPPKDGTDFNDWLGGYTRSHKMKTDEDILDDMDFKVIEKYVRKKKLNKIKPK